MKKFIYNKKANVIPGFNIAFGITILYITLVVLIPLSGLFIKASSLTLKEFFKVITQARVLSAYKLSFKAAFIAAIINSFFGFILAWVIVKYNFFGKKLIDSMIDLPFALPTAVAGIALTSIYSPDGWLGKILALVGIKVAFTPLGIIIALVFVGTPFVVRTLEPVLYELDKELEEASISLGATQMQTFFKITLPNLFPAFLTGFALSFARGLGEYGSVIFIAGNIPMVSEIVPLILIIKLEQFDYKGATAIASVMLIVSFLLLLAINLLQKWSTRYNNR